MSRGVLTDDAFTALRNKAGQLINVNVTRYRESDTSPDFMSMGKPGQSLVDISGGNIGGGGEFCHLSNTQDETLMMFYPEVVFGIIFSTYRTKDSRRDLAVFRRSITKERIRSQFALPNLANWR